MKGLIDTIAVRTGLSRTAVHTAWSPVARALLTAIADDVEVAFFGLGHLRAVFRPEQTHTHPITGQELTMPAERVLMLSPAPALFCAANPGWTLEDAATTIADTLPMEWEERTILDASALLTSDHPDLDDALIDAIVEAVILAAAQQSEGIVVIDGLGELQLVHSPGYIGTHPDTRRPLVHRSRNWLRLEPGLELRAELALN